MKKILLVAFMSIFVAFISEAQITFSQFITFETPSPNLQIDTTLLDNIWQIGIPDKDIFDGAYSLPNTIITDTVNYYPINNHSVFTIVIKDSLWFQGSPSTMAFRYKYDTDPGKDGGYIDVSYNGGTSWQNIIYDTILTHCPDNPGGTTTSTNFYTAADTIIGGIPAFSGATSVWTFSEFQWKFCLHTKDFPPDSVMFRFHFVSDSIQNNKEGWMIDNIYFTSHLCLGIDENSIDNFESSLFPNPLDENSVLKFNNPKNEVYTLEIFNLLGVKVKETIINSGKATLSKNDFQNGIYFYRLTNSNQQTSKGKFVIE